MYISRNGRVLLNPSEKGRKYASELKTKKGITVDGQVKKNKNGQVIQLSNTQLAYRSGYMQAQKDSSRAFKSKHPNYQRKTK